MRASEVSPAGRPLFDEVLGMVDGQARRGSSRTSMRFVYLLVKSARPRAQASLNLYPFSVSSFWRLRAASRPRTSGCRSGGLTIFSVSLARAASAASWNVAAREVRPATILSCAPLASSGGSIALKSVAVFSIALLPSSSSVAICAGSPAGLIFAYRRRQRRLALLTLVTYSFLSAVQPQPVTSAATTNATPMIRFIALRSWMPRVAIVRARCGPDNQGGTLVSVGRPWSRCGKKGRWRAPGHADVRRLRDHGDRAGARSGPGRRRSSAGACRAGRAAAADRRGTRSALAAAGEAALAGG